jgi:DNA-binding NarL/FixJ family response regulator
MTNCQLIRLLLVDDHLMVRMGIKGWVERSIDIELIAEAGNARDAMTLIEAHDPSVILLDLQLPDLHGIEATRQILERWPHARILMLSVDETEESIHAAEQSGALGYVAKSVNRQELLTAIRTVAAGERHFEGNIGERLAIRALRVGLSAREIDVLRLVALGKANKEIAQALGLSLFTVKNHLAHILSKLDAPDRTRAVTIAMERGLLRAE